MKYEYQCDVSNKALCSQKYDVCYCFKIYFETIIELK